MFTISDQEKIQPENVVSVALNKDIETYSVGVENAFQGADINHYLPDFAEYTTRSDWSKGWQALSQITPTDEMMVGLTNSKYQLTANDSQDVVWGEDNGLRAVDFIMTDDEGHYQGVLPLSDDKWNQLINQVPLEEAANFIEKAGDKNFEALESIDLAESLWYDGPIGYSYDQIAGYATRWTPSNSDEPTYVAPENQYASYSLSSMPTEPVVAATFNKALVRREGELFGEDSLWTNANALAAPGLNIHRTTYCSRNHEYYSEDPMLTNLLGQSLSAGAKSKGLMTIAKHYAFNHQELNRSGISTFFDEQAGRENELRCFQGVMSNNDTQGVMTGFNRIGTVFSGADEGTQIQVARNEWGYEGYFITDMVNGADYMNWKDTVFGGGGGCLTTSAYENAEIGSMVSSDNLALIGQDKAFQEKMHESLKYHVYNIVSSNAMNAITSSTRYVKVLTWWQYALVAVQLLFGVLTLICIMLLANTILKQRKGH